MEIPAIPGLPTLPALDDVRDRARVVTCPLRVPFRGVTEREVMLVEAPNGWVGGRRSWSTRRRRRPAAALRWARLG